MNRIVALALSLIALTCTACAGNMNARLVAEAANIRTIPLASFFDSLTAVKRGRGMFNTWVYRQGHGIEKNAIVSVPAGTVEINLAGPRKAYTISIGGGESEIMVPTSLERLVPIMVNGKSTKKRVALNIIYTCKSMMMDECLGRLAALLTEREVMLQSVGGMMFPKLAGEEQPVIFNMTTDPDGKSTW